MRKRVNVSNITCANCAKSIESHFEKQDDIDAKVLVTSSAVIFNYNNDKYNEEYLHDELLSIGYYAIEDDETVIKAKKKDRIDLITALVFTLPLLYTMFHHLGMTFMPMPNILMNGYFQLILATPVLFYSGRRFFIATYHSIKNRNLGMDSLVVIGTSAAYIYSLVETITTNGKGMNLFFETTAVIILMVLLGNYFENRIKEKTSATLTGLLSLGSKDATILKDGIELTVPIESVQVGDIVIVKGYDKIPVDGVIISGKTYVDESMLTGESMPVLKGIGNDVIGSSMNIMETIQIEVTKIGSDTVLSKIIQTVEDTTLIKPKAQRIADKIASLFVPIVVVISILVFLTYFFIVPDAKFNVGLAISPAIAVLVVSCPCALGLATPTSISVSSGLAFKNGVLYKGGEFFEIANKITAIAFDKTGTLTEGKPVVTDFLGNEDTIKITASLETHSVHPIAKAITSYYKKDLYDVTDYETLIGYGIKGKINNEEIYVVSISYILENNIKNIFTDYDEYHNQGKTTFFTIKNDEVINMFAIADEIKESSYALIKELKARNIKPYMVTGDQEITAKYIAGLLGINDVYSGVLPHEKADIVSKIQETEEVVAFIGDGINDAPALKVANVGFAIGSGADIAIDTADVTLMNNDMKTVLYAIDLSKATLKNIYVNFFWAFIYNIVLIPLAALGIFSPVLAGFGMAFSSLMVILNALSLKLWKFKYNGGINNERN